VQPLDLSRSRRRALLLEIEADFPHRDDARVGAELAHVFEVMRRRLCRVMADSRPNLVVPVRKGDSLAIAFCVHPHRHHARDPCTNRRAHHLCRVTQLLKVEVGVYEDAGSSSSV